MQILFLSHRVPFPPNKGEKIRTYYQIKHLAAQGHHIVLFTPVETAEDINNANKLKQVLCKDVVYDNKPNAWSHLKGLASNKPLSVTNFHSVNLQKKLTQYLSAQSIDAIICTSSSMAEYVFQLKQTLRNNSRLIMDFMDLDSDKWNQYTKLKSFPMNLIYWRESKLLSAYEQRIHREFDASFFISKNEVSLFLRKEKDLGKLHVVANGMDTSSFQPVDEKPQQGPNLLFTGVMDYLPNIDAVCWFVENAWPKIIEKMPDAKFYIAGMNPTTKVEALQQSKGVIVTGFVDDIRSYFDRAHIFVAPFRIARGVQNKVLQAFASGLPTVGTAMAAEGISCKNNVHMLITDDADEMVEKIIWITANPAEAIKLGENAVQLVKEKYSWEGKLTKLDNLLQ
ncbi:MAG: TIGR03087 family PEP-CTERM/XrtA system glycosyltransferase [Cellvibrionaceae bacterium]|nr:TIGR03087 family PEP-CTERM/XrtA system glycosyltransferase [Cellvibrionaceae bacterium]